MELTTMMDQYLGAHGATTLDALGPETRMFHDIYGSETLTSPLVATTFWQAFIESPAFAKSLWRAGASSTAIFEGERFIVSHGSGWPRQDLVIFDPSHDSRDPVVIAIQPEPDNLVEGWERFRQRNRLTDPQFRFHQLAAIEASSAQPFGAIVVGRPPIEFTRNPSPPWSVAPYGTSSTATAVSTAGVVAQNNRKQIGITAALHALSGAKQALVEGQVGNVVSEDVISDSCFIEVPGCKIPPKGGLAGPLRGVTPRQLEPVKFEGITSSIVQTVVIGWSVDLPFVLPYSQLKVITKPVTNAGDSGAALIDSNDQIIGFAFYRTGFGAPIEYAVWIWADSVFEAHRLSII